MCIYLKIHSGSLLFRSKPDIKMEPSSGRPVDYQVKQSPCWVNIKGVVVDVMMSIKCSFTFRSVWQWLKPDSWWDWTWIQWYAWRSEKIKSTPQWRSQLTAPTTTKWVSQHVTKFASKYKIKYNSKMFSSPVFCIWLPRPPRSHVWQNPETVCK